ncbi:hypothetical protein CMV_011312 [Castanea mollissima]|uniref:Uncharacterized protein n=1 Tax=Castanea mollissima TaxID=60419 RepID=A0A8J4R3R1_9ROSI|nr:hypothetical protein CMV_011312 [Castanea mollissima]
MRPMAPTSTRCATIIELEKILSSQKDKTQKFHHNTEKKKKKPENFKKVQDSESNTIRTTQTSTGAITNG